MVGRTRGATAAPRTAAAAVVEAWETAVPEANANIVPRHMAATADLLDFDSLRLFLLPAFNVKYPALGFEKLPIIICNRGVPPEMLGDELDCESVGFGRRNLLPWLKAASSGTHLQAKRRKLSLPSCHGEHENRGGISMRSGTLQRTLTMLYCSGAAVEMM